MIKPIAEEIGAFNTVGEAVKVLLTLPKDYLLHPLGQQCVIGIDHVNECVYMEDPNCIGEYTTELLEEALEMDEPTEIDVPLEKLETYKPDVYVVMGYSDDNQNGGEQAHLIGVFSTEALATECGDKLVKNKAIIRYEIEAPKIDERTL